MIDILLIDDDDRLRTSFEKVLTDEGYALKSASSCEDGLELLREFAPSIVILDVRMPGMSGLEMLKTIRQLDTQMPVIIMTAFSTTETAIEATKLGAYDYVIKPFKTREMLELIEQALSAGSLMRSKVSIDDSPQSTKGDAMIGQSRVMQEVFKSIGRVAETNATVLIRGASGTGKELVARAIYQHSKRNNKPFTVINCVAIPENLLESELFGYEKGAFTGADRRKIGRIEQASGGTILLDEIGDMPAGTQAKILRLLQEKSMERLGGNEVIPVDIRVLAATNKNLEEALATGRFREDLYYRMRVVTIELPPLCERENDVLLLAEYFLNRFAREFGVTNPGLSDEAKSAILTHSWPGNVRELANTLQKALIFSRGYQITPGDIFQHEFQESTTGSEISIETVLAEYIRSEMKTKNHKEFLTYIRDFVSRLTIEEVLKLTGGNRSQAAKLLGVTRPTLHAQLNKYGLGSAQSKDADEAES
ncbi:MAG: sigma-54 dependent transcriptional regulator [Candidatus Zixiibacteriota bacterium]